MAINPAQLNLLGAMQAQQPVNPVQVVSNGSSNAEEGAKSNNPFSSQLFAGNTSGLNNLQTGDVVNTAAQAGKPAGISRILAIA